MDLLKKIDLFINDQISGATTTANVAQNLAKGHVDVVGGRCPKGQVYDKVKKVCVPVKNEAEYIYIKHKRKDKTRRVPKDKKVLKKYMDKGWEIVESSVVGGSYVDGTTVNIVGSGQTRVWGERFYQMIDLDRKEPVEVEMDDKGMQNILGRKGLKFDNILGAYVPTSQRETEDE